MPTELMSHSQTLSLQGAYRLEIISARLKGSGDLTICFFFWNAPVGAREFFTSVKFAQVANYKGLLF